MPNTSEVCPEYPEPRLTLMPGDKRVNTDSAEPAEGERFLFEKISKGEILMTARKIEGDGNDGGKWFLTIGQMNNYLLPDWKSVIAVVATVQEWGYKTNEQSTQPDAPSIDEIVISNRGQKVD